MQYQYTATMTEPPRHRTPSLRQSNVAWALVGLSLIILWMMAMASIGSTGPDVTMGQVMCEGFVSDQLRAPGTATFARGSDKTVTANADGSVTLRSFVDAQNGFGAQARTRFTCTVQEVPERKTWRLVSLDIAP